MSDFIGDRGQSLAHARLTKICRKNETSFFKAYFLGDKSKTLDFYVELVCTGQKRPYFFVQVKATRNGYRFNNDPVRRSLRVAVKKADLAILAVFPAPTYVVGVDEDSERAYIIGVIRRSRTGLSSITTRYELTPANLKRLWEEVKEYWDERDMQQSSTSFAN